MTRSPAAEVAHALLSIGAVAIRPNPPFRYRSGMLSPIYTDNRLLCSYPRQRILVAERFAELLERHNVRPDVVAGVSTAGIPHAAWLAQRLEVPMVYVRGEAKDHGKGKRVEGTLRPLSWVIRDDRRTLPSGDSEASTASTNARACDAVSPASPAVVVVEDLVTTGGGALDAVAGVREEGGTVHYCLAICTYGFQQTVEAFAAADVTLLTLCTFDDLARAAEDAGLLTPDERAIALDWRADPAGWAARHGLHADA